MQPVHQITSNVTRKHGKKQHDKSNDLSTVDPNLSRLIHFFRSKRRKLSGLINTECLTQKSSLSKQDESHNANELTKSHISVWQTQVSKHLTRKQCLHLTFPFQVWISDTFKNNWHLRCILRQPVKTNALRCSHQIEFYRRFWPAGPRGTRIGLRSNVIRNTLYTSAKWSFLYADVAATKTRSRRVYPFGIRSPPVISKWSSAGGISMAYLDSRYFDKRWRRYATGEVLKCCTGCTETYKKSSPRALIDRTYGSPRIPDTSEPSSMRNRNVSWSKSRTLSFSTAGINITVPAWICGSSSSLYPNNWSSVRSVSCILLAMNESLKTLLDPGISILRSCEPQAWKKQVKIKPIKISLNFLSILQNPKVTCLRPSCRNKRRLKV